MSWNKIAKDKSEIIKEMNGFGLKVLEENNLTNLSSNLKMMDESGYLYYSSPTSIRSAIKRNTFIRRFDLSNPFSIENIDTFLIDIKSNTKLLSREYLGIKSKYNFLCGDCNEVFEYSLDRLVNSKNRNKGFVCKKCARKKLADLQRLSYDSIVQEFNKNELIPCFLEEDYRNTQSILKYKTKDGYLGDIRISHLKKRGMENVSMFRQNSQYFEYNLNLLCSNLDIKFNGIKEYKDNTNSTLLDLSCRDCGESFYTTKANLLKGKTRCDKCTKKKSSLENKTCEWLAQNSIIFVEQKRFENLKYKHKLSFDFYVESINLLIECDGEFHYATNSLMNEKQFKQQQIRDEIKNNYCIENNIKLLRIPYWEFKNDNYKQILTDNILNQN